MDPKTRVLSLVAGCFLLFYGLKKLYEEGDWTIVILGVLIVAFTASNIIRHKQKQKE